MLTVIICFASKPKVLAVFLNTVKPNMLAVVWKIMKVNITG